MTFLFILLRHTNTDPRFVLVLIGIFILVSIVTYYFSRKAKVLRGLQRQGIKRIKDFADGDNGKVVGKVVFAGKKIYAPLSKRPCSYYHVIVEQYKRHGKSSSWVKIIEEEHTGDVVIQDGTGYAIIDTGKTMCYLIPDMVYTSGTFDDATPELETFLARHQNESTGLFGFNKELRYKEGILEKGEMFAVAGEGQWNKTQDHELNLPTAKVLVITAQAEEKVYLSDDPVTLEDPDAIEEPI
jgi:hypothetical protein